MNNYVLGIEGTRKNLKSKSSSIKIKAENLFEELKSTHEGGFYYKKYKGKPLLKLMKKLKINNFIIYSCKLNNINRFIYEYYKINKIIDGIRYDSIIHITDCGNHEYRGIPYT